MGKAIMCAVIFLCGAITARGAESFPMEFMLTPYSTHIASLVFGVLTGIISRDRGL